jgi:hypothetical protein
LQWYIGRRQRRPNQKFNPPILPILHLAPAAGNNKLVLVEKEREEEMLFSCALALGRRKNMYLTCEHNIYIPDDRVDIHQLSQGHLVNS